MVIVQAKFQLHIVRRFANFQSFNKSVVVFSVRKRTITSSSNTADENTSQSMVNPFLGPCKSLLEY